MATVRRATARDLDDIVRMGEAMHKESPRYRSMRFDASKVRALAARLIDMPQGELFVAERGCEVIGMAAAVVGERWFGPDRYVTDLAVYLMPQHRGSGVFMWLVRVLEAWAVEMGVQDVDLGISTGIGVEETVRAYQHLGYTVADTRVVTKRLDHVHRS